ncbi:SusC/RagA family TonB-linked outer membrane protein [Flavivirga jejuensis]|uniref:TonB-dependent receptor n=1 Tax=Flavivirga jejuensis TaxID=870487 RepID=A0ABT8WJT3_9FLAO|nr:TonB-dependent receptor [Flavivirga jejuensis]MDO5973424.1 TonB-dependent receptor [Flavivirga jejuensis]
MNSKNKLTLIAVLFFNSVLFAQNVTVLKGVVTSASDGIPIPGVNVIVVGTSNGVSTDFDGKYQIKAKVGGALQFSYLGFISQTVIIDKQTTINVSLIEDVSQLDEVVVIGYGTQKKSHLTGSISKVVNDDLDQIAVSRVDDALIGQVSGVNIQTTDGEAGAAPTITIRGIGSMAGDSTPLIVVDGVIVDSDFLGSLNMNDVESFEVLKDAASSSIFGSKGSNGIIMITMKSGLEGKVKVNYSSYTGIKTGRKSDAYGQTVASWAKKQEDLGLELSDYTKFGLSTGTDRSWQDVFIGSGIITNHALSLRGGNDKTKFATSINYSNDEGVLLLDNYEKFAARAKIDFKINKKFSAGINFSPSYTIRKRFSENIHNVARHMPWLPIYHTEHTLNYIDPNGAFADVQVGDYAQMRHFEFTDLDGDGIYEEELTSNLGNSSNQNPYARIAERERTDNKFKLFNNIYGQYKITDNLNFKSSLSVSIQDTQRKDYLGTLARRETSDAYIDEITQRDQYIIFDNFFNYNKSFGNHDISATLGNSIEKRNYFFSFVRGIGIVNDKVQQLSNASITSDSDGFEWTKRGVSYVSRVNYAYNDKYLVNLSLRRDGSSIFGSDFKYGNFPSASIGWNIDRESFLEESDIISKLKFRASYGVTGNDRLNTGSVDPDAQGSTSQLSTGNILVDYYPSLDLVSNVSYVEDGTIQSGYAPVNIGNLELKWERLIEINPGIDFGLFNNRISGSVDWYQRTSDQLLLNNPISSTTGFSESLQNIGEVKNEGWEFELRTKNVRSEKFNWNSTILLTTNENTLVDFADSDGQITDLDPKRPTEWINSVGQPISSFYGYVVDAEIPIEDFSSSNFYRHVGQETGVVYVKDLNGDGVLDQEDKTILGNPYPELIWSFSNEFNYGGLSLSFMFQGSHGAEVRNIADQYLFNHTAFDEVNTNVVDDEFVVEKIFTNSIIQDASYIALRNVNIGYSLPESILSKLKGITNFKIYVAGQNLMYLTSDDYTGWNPEALDKTSPTQYGYQRGGSPVTSTVSLGVNIDF